MFIVVVDVFDELVGAVLDIVQASRVAGDERPDDGNEARADG